MKKQAHSLRTRIMPMLLALVCIRGLLPTAALAAAVVNGKCEPYAKLLLRGGELNIEWNRDENLIYMTGPAVTVFDGELLL